MNDERHEKVWVSAGLLAVLVVLGLFAWGVATRRYANVQRREFDALERRVEALERGR